MKRDCERMSKSSSNKLFFFLSFFLKSGRAGSCYDGFLTLDSKAKCFLAFFGVKGIAGRDVASH